jgi:hypothetical protein
LDIITEDPTGLSTFKIFIISVLDQAENATDFQISNTTILEGSTIGSTIGKISAQSPTEEELTFALAPDQDANMRHFFLEADGTLSLQDDLEPGTYSLNIQAFLADQPVGAHSVTVTILPDAFIEPTGKEYHDSALMVTEVDAVDDPLRSGHNPIVKIENRQSEGLFVTTAQPHGRKVGDSVVLTGVEGLIIKDLLNWNFTIDEVEPTSFRLRHFGKDHHGHYDGSLGPLAQADGNSAYLASAKDYLLGEWTFGHLVGNMIGEQDDPMEFMRHYSSQWTHVQRVNGYKTDPRRALLLETHEMNLANLPFRLLAIGNRLDLFSAQSVRQVSNAGEGRFVFTLTEEFKLPKDEQGSFLRISHEARDQSRFTLIFEYGLKAKNFHTLAEWTRDWHALARLRKESSFEEYLNHLAKMGDRFTKRGADPDKPNGNSINQVRTNDFVLGNFSTGQDWQMREFNLFSLKAAQSITNRWTKLKSDVTLSGEQIGLWTTTNKGNPMVLVPEIPENAPKQPEDANYTVNDRRGRPLHADSKFLGEWINGMEAKILDGEVAPPSPGWMVGGISDQPMFFNGGHFFFTYQIPGVRVNLARHKFSLSTCSGCHTGDTSTRFQMIRSNGGSKGAPNPAFMAKFMVGDKMRNDPNLPHPLKHEVADLINSEEKHYFFDLQSREDIIRDALKVIDLIYEAKIGLTQVDFSELPPAGEPLTQVFVEGGALADWEFSLVSGLGDSNNPDFSIDTDGAIRLVNPFTTTQDRAAQLRIQAKATDGSGVIIERPVSLWMRSLNPIDIPVPIDGPIFDDPFFPIDGPITIDDPFVEDSPFISEPIFFFPDMQILPIPELILRNLPDFETPRPFRTH